MATIIRKSTRSQAKGRAVQAARAKARLHQLCDLSDQGMSMEDATQALGMTKSGVKSMLTRELGTTCWPIRQEG